ncbi:hypothetical protein A2U01_0097415, partial [Trifolium medium]|nr:hypothetical protein [Trifolium medium]
VDAPENDNKQMAIGSSNQYANMETPSTKTDHFYWPALVGSARDIECPQLELSGPGQPECNSSTR